jgi:hypothetical protein
VVQVYALGSGGVGEAAGGHAQEHGFADPPRYLITIHRWGVLRIDNRLHLNLTAGVGEESAYLVEGERSDSFEACGPAEQVPACRSCSQAVLLG